MTAKGRRDKETPAKQGLRQGKALEILLWDYTRPAGKPAVYSEPTHGRLFRDSLGFASIGRGEQGSNNIRLVAHTAAIVYDLLNVKTASWQGTEDHATWCADYLAAELDLGPEGCGIDGKECGPGGDYPGMTAATVRALLLLARGRWPRLAELAQAYLDRKMAFVTLAAVPWQDVDQLGQAFSPHVRIAGFGERCQGHHDIPLSLVLADYLGLEATPKWLRRLADPRKLMSTTPVKNLQINAWVYRVWAMAGGGQLGDQSKLLRLLREGFVDRDLMTARLEHCRVRRSFHFLRFQNKLVAIMGRWVGDGPDVEWNVNHLSTPGHAAVTERTPGGGSRSSYLTLEADIRRGIRPSACAWGVNDAGVLVIKAESPEAGLAKQLEVDLAFAGPLLSWVHFPADGKAVQRPWPAG